MVLRTKPRALPMNVRLKLCYLSHKPSPGTLPSHYNAIVTMRELIVVILILTFCCVSGGHTVGLGGPSRGSANPLLGGGGTVAD